MIRLLIILVTAATSAACPPECYCEPNFWWCDGIKGIHTWDSEIPKSVKVNYMETDDGIIPWNNIQILHLIGPSHVVSLLDWGLNDQTTLTDLTLERQLITDMDWLWDARSTLRSLTLRNVGQPTAFINESRTPPMGSVKVLKIIDSPLENWNVNETLDIDSIVLKNTNTFAITGKFIVDKFEMYNNPSLTEFPTIQFRKNAYLVFDNTSFPTDETLVDYTNIKFMALTNVRRPIPLWVGKVHNLVYLNIDNTDVNSLKVIKRSPIRVLTIGGNAVSGLPSFDPKWLFKLVVRSFSGIWSLKLDHLDLIYLTISGDLRDFTRGKIPKARVYDFSNSQLRKIRPWYFEDIKKGFTVNLDNTPISSIHHLAGKARRVSARYCLNLPCKCLKHPYTTFELYCLFNGIWQDPCNPPVREVANITTDTDKLTLNAKTIKPIDLIVHNPSNLTSMTLNYVNFKSWQGFGFIRGFNKLTSLKINGHPAIDTNLFATVATNLKTLYLANMPLTEIPETQSLLNLRELTIENTAIKEIKAYMPNLQSLTIINSPTDVHQLPLSTLIIRRMTKSPVLSNLPHVHTLELQSNSLKRLPSLTSIPIKTLNLQDFTSLTTLKGLEKVNLHTLILGADQFPKPVTIPTLFNLTIVKSPKILPPLPSTEILTVTDRDLRHLKYPIKAKKSIFANTDLTVIDNNVFPKSSIVDISNTYVISLQWATNVAKVIGWNLRVPCNRFLWDLMHTVNYQGSCMRTWLLRNVTSIDDWQWLIPHY